MYKHIAWFVATFVATCFSAAVLADEGSKATTMQTPNAEAKTAVMGTFESLDKNGDERISRTEAGVDKRLSNIFATADTDGDGYVSKAEYVARPQS
jgi:Ca2+-binding EF-hand superfamily protein